MDRVRYLSREGLGGVVEVVLARTRRWRLLSSRTPSMSFQPTGASVGVNTLS